MIILLTIVALGWALLTRLRVAFEILRYASDQVLQVYTGFRY